MHGELTLNAYNATLLKAWEANMFWMDMIVQYIMFRIS